jgi:hypothetical protein
MVISNRHQHQLFVRGERPSSLVRRDSYESQVGQLPFGSTYAGMLDVVG